MKSTFTLLLVMLLSTPLCASAKEPSVEAADVLEYAKAKASEWKEVENSLKLLEKSAKSATMDTEKSLLISLPTQILEQLGKVGLVTSDTFVGWMENTHDYMIPHVVIRGIQLCHEKGIKYGAATTVPVYVNPSDHSKLIKELVTAKQNAQRRAEIYGQMAGKMAAGTPSRGISSMGTSAHPQ